MRAIFLADNWSSQSQLAPAQVHNPLVAEKWSLGQVSFFNQLLALFLGWGFLLGVLVFLAVFFFGALKWILAGGDENKVKSARQTLSSGLLGLMVLFVIFVILKVIGQVFGIHHLENLHLPVPSLQ